MMIDKDRVIEEIRKLKSDALQNCVVSELVI